MSSNWMAMRILGLVAIAVVAAAAGCGDSRDPNGSSETHFLRECSDSSCGAGLKCICGACTKECSADSSCRSLAEDATCMGNSGASCFEQVTCDVECDADGDCAALSSAHRCEQGRCRAPDSSTSSAGSAGRGGASGGRGGSGGGAARCGGPGCASGSGASPGGPDGNGCEPIDILWQVAPRMDVFTCGAVPVGASDASQEVSIECVRNELAAGNAFELSWQIQGPASVRTLGLIGVRDGDEMLVYSFAYDRFGLDELGTNGSWSRCASFTIGAKDECNGVDACLRCDTEGTGVCLCTGPTPPATAASLRCTGDPTRPPTDCPVPSSCLFDGVCYPSGTTSEDGCCSCNNGEGACIEPGWCPGWVLIGKRCASNEDCDAPRSGLECRSDFFGERGVCTRDCGYGCPTGTECLDGVPDYNGGTIDNVCMRFCASAETCDLVVRGESLASECDRPENLRRSYCF